MLWPGWCSGIPLIGVVENWANHRSPKLNILSAIFPLLKHYCFAGFYYINSVSMYRLVVLENWPLRVHLAVAYCMKGRILQLGFICLSNTVYELGTSIDSM
jgi:hypothetical protein